MHILKTVKRNAVSLNVKRNAVSLHENVKRSPVSLLVIKKGVLCSRYW